MEEKNLWRYLKEIEDILQFAKEQYEWEVKGIQEKIDFIKENNYAGTTFTEFCDLLQELDKYRMLLKKTETVIAYLPDDEEEK